MTSSAYPSTPETTYNNRICRVLLGPCSDQLRDVLRLHVPPGSFPNIVRKYRSKLPRLTTNQRNIILPRTGHYSGDYSDMDISLLYLLLRNLCSTWIPQHVNGWGNSPDIMDFTVSANIERIREARNKISHSSSTFLSKAEFTDIWSDIKRAVISMDTYLKNGNKYEKEIDFLRTETMDPEQAQFYTEQLRKQVEEDTRTHHKVIKLQESVSDQKKVLRALNSKIQRTNTKVQSHKREIDKIKQQMQKPFTLPKQKGHFQAEVSHRAETLDDQVEILYSRCKPHAIPGADLRNLIRSINESEADRIQILPLKTDDRIEVDKIYVPVLICDEYDRTNRKSAPNISPDRIFYVKESVPARFVFMLGEAGYGKTVQCQKMAKVWCKVWGDEYARQSAIQATDLERCLKEFDFLFFIQMREVNAVHVSVKDMICDAYSRYNISCDNVTNIRNVLENKNHKCLILLDGLDEWTLYECRKEYLLNKGIPNCADLPNCTILITMRSWKFLEVIYVCRQNFDTVIRIQGLDDNGIHDLTEKMWHNYFHKEGDVKEFEMVIRIALSAPPGLKSLMKIPLLAVFRILTCYENVEIGHSLTTFYLSLLEALIKRSLNREQIGYSSCTTYESSISSVLQNYFHVSNCMPKLSRLGKMAFDGLSSQNRTLVFSDEQLQKPEVKETVDFFLRIGLLSKLDASGQAHENNRKIIFLHKTIQEFLSSLYLFHGRSVCDIINIVTSEVSDTEKALELSSVLTFLSGLSPVVGCEISSHITELSSKDEDICRYRAHFSTESYNKVFHLFNLQLSCYREVREWKSIPNYQDNEKGKKEMKFSLSDIILLGSDTDTLTIRESADILRYHSNDIKSLCMECIPDDSCEGITNKELKDFLDKSESILSLNIDGYHRGKCRLFDDFSRRISCLCTLGLSNVAFTDNILIKVLTEEESKRRLSALGLTFIRAHNELAVDYQYQVASITRLCSRRSGYRHKRRMLSLPASDPQLQEMGNKTPLLKDILKLLLIYNDLSTLYVSYMDSDEDRQMLLQVLPQIKALDHFGYSGSSIYPKPDEVYDIEVIKVLLKINQLRIIYLNQINLREHLLNLEKMSRLEELILEFFCMHVTEWLTLVKSLPTIKSMGKIILNDTNIDDETYELLKSYHSLNIVKDESTTW